MASASTTLVGPIATVEADEDPATLTIPPSLSKVSLLNLGPDDVVIRTKTGAFTITDPGSPAQVEGEAVLPVNQSFPLLTNLGFVQYRTAAGDSAFLTVAVDSE